MGYKYIGGIMKLRFKGGKTSSCLVFDTETKTYITFNGTGSDMIHLDTCIALRDLELELIKNGYRKEEL